MSMNKSNTVEAHVSSTPLVICVGNESRMWEFEENGFPAFVYKQLRVELEYPGAPNYGGPLSPVTYETNFETEKLDKRLYEFGLEGRRVVIVAPPYTGPRKGNPADHVASLLREEGARVSIVPDEGDVIEAVKAATQTFGGFSASSPVVGVSRRR